MKIARARIFFCFLFLQQINVVVIVLLVQKIKSFRRRSKTNPSRSWHLFNCKKSFFFHLLFLFWCFFFWFSFGILKVFNFIMVVYKSFINKLVNRFKVYRQLIVKCGKTFITLIGFLSIIWLLYIVKKVSSFFFIVIV